MSDVLYRFDIVRYSNGVDQFDEPLPGHTVGLSCNEYPIVRRTPKGVWIDRGCMQKFVLLTATKQWACETKELAAESFLRRKVKQIQILRAQIADAEEAMRLLAKQINKGFTNG